MPRKKVFSKKSIYDNIKKTIDKEKQNLNVTPSLDLVKNAGGSINNLPVKTKAFTSWLSAHQKVNPFIGKHAQYSQEDSIEEVQLDDQEELVGKDANTILDIADESAKEFKSSSTFGYKEEDIGPSLKDNDNHDKKFIDLIIAENLTKKLLHRPEEEIIKEATKTIKSYHENDDYEILINLSNVIEQSKTLYIEQEKEAKIKNQNLLK